MCAVSLILSGERGDMEEELGEVGGEGACFTVQPREWKYRARV